MIWYKKFEVVRVVLRKEKLEVLDIVDENYIIKF